MKIRMPSLPLQLIGVILSVFFFGKLLPYWFVRISYTFSIIIRELLGVILPFMVFFFVLDGILSFQKKAPVVLSVMLGTIFCSNGIVALFSYGVINLVAPVISCDRSALTIEQLKEVSPLFHIELPFSINAVHALLAAIVIGLCGSFYPLGINNAVGRAKAWIEKLLQMIIIPCLPFYIFGFLLKIRYEEMLVCLFKQYGSIFVLVVVMQTAYLIFLYIVACEFNIKKTIRAMRNTLPSYLTAFSTMSSVIAIPDAIRGAIKNTKNEHLADIAMPIMANAHLLGSSIGIPMLAMVTMLIFQGALPSLIQYAFFVLYFCFSMFAASGIPGGGILVIIPILKSYLGFDAEMVSVLLAIYLLMDSFVTAANIMGDGALVIIVNRILRKFGVTQ